MLQDVLENVSVVTFVFLIRAVIHGCVFTDSNSVTYRFSNLWVSIPVLSSYASVVYAVLIIVYILHEDKRKEMSKYQKY